MKREFILNTSIKPEHTDLPIRQIYVWFVTSDNKIIIVGNGKGKFQFPGGKPEADESISDTIAREMFEETGVKIQELSEAPVMFGYYIVEKDPDWPDFPRYLQLRFYVFTQKASGQIPLSINEREDDVHTMQEVMFVDSMKLPEYIPWTAETPEYKHILELRQ